MDQKEKNKLRQKLWREKNKEKFTNQSKQWRKEYCDKHPQKRLLWAAKKRAKEQNLPFNIEESDIIIPSKCPYLNIDLVTSSRRGDSRENVLSLDKIIPELGYIKGNVEVI